MWRVGTLCLAWHGVVAWSLVPSGLDIAKGPRRRMTPITTRTKAMDSPVMEIGEKDTSQYQKTVEKSIRRIEQDMMVLESMVGSRAQLTGTEFAFLLACAGAAGFSPFLFSEKVVEVLVPSAAALSAAVGISAEYVGKSAIYTGKEISAVTTMAAAEAESVVADAERAKAIIPLCVGVSTTASAFALLAPELLKDIGSRYGVELITELYLISPIVSVIGAVIAVLAFQETQGLCKKAMGVGVRRFAKSDDVGQSWLSASEQVVDASDTQSAKFKAFALGLLPAPLLAALCPGPLAFKAIVAATTGACQAGYFLAKAEYSIARAVDSVALKLRAAAVSETYANQGVRTGSILPFTSAIGGLCAASAAAAVEALPFLAHENVYLQGAICFLFPALASFTAAAASVSKARCEVDATAAAAASESFADPKLLSINKNEKNALGLFSGVMELGRQTAESIVAVAGRSAEGFLLMTPFGKKNSVTAKLA